MAVVAGVEELSERVMMLVAEETGRDRAVITMETGIERDLGCSAVEARDLLLRMEREFGIDMGDLQLHRHFDLAGAPGWPVGVAMVVAFPVSFVAMLCLAPALQVLGVSGSRFAATGGLFILTYLACFLVLGFMTILLPRLRARGAEKIEVTVQMLIEAAVLKTWPVKYAEGKSR